MPPAVPRRPAAPAGATPRAQAACSPGPPTGSCARLRRRGRRAPDRRGRRGGRRGPAALTGPRLPRARCACRAPAAGPAVARGAVLRDARLCVALAWAAGLNGQFSRMGPWLDAADTVDRRRQPRPGGLAHPARGRGDVARASKSASPTPTRGGAGRGDGGMPAGVRPDRGRLRGGADRARRDARLRRPVRTRRCAPWTACGTARGPSGCRRCSRLQAASILAMVLARDRPDGPAPPAVGRGRRRRSGPPRTGGATPRSRRRAPADRRGRARPSGRRPRPRPCAAAARRRPRPHLRRDPVALVTALTALAEVELDGHDRAARPRRARRGPGRRRQRAGAPAHRAPAGRGRAAGRPDGGPGRRVAAVPWSRS